MAPRTGRRFLVVGLLMATATAASQSVRDEPTIVSAGRVMTTVAQTPRPAVDTSTTTSTSLSVTSTTRPVPRLPRRPSRSEIRPSEPIPSPAVADPRAAAAVSAAISVAGHPYRWGGAGPDVFDCSGLAMWAWAHAGVRLPHSSYAQLRGRRVPISDLLPGDLVFSNRGGHVGIYLGGGKMIHAPHRGDVVRVAAADFSSGAVRP